MRWAGVMHSGQGTLVCIERTRRVSCAVVSSTSHASRRSVVASGNKRTRTLCSDVETKVGSSSRQCCLWGHRKHMPPQQQGGHAWVWRYIKDNPTGSQDIPEWHITKSGQESILWLKSWRRVSCVSLFYQEVLLPYDVERYALRV